MSDSILVFDTETTGLTLHPDADLAKQPKMIEFGASLLSPVDGSVREEIEILINPGELVSAEITKITGINNDDLKDARPFLEVLPQILRVFHEARSVVAHNLPFDKAILRGEIARAKLVSFPWPQSEFCTVGIYREHWGRNPRLIELYEHVIGRPLNQEHRGLADVRALVEIIQHEELWRFM